MMNVVDVFLSFQNKTCSLLILTSAFSCVRELTDCEERGEPTISSCANKDLPPCISTSMYMQIYLNKCLKGHKSLGLLLGGVLKMSLSLSLSLYLSL